jgi:hypothetical protein
MRPACPPRPGKLGVEVAPRRLGGPGPGPAPGLAPALAIDGKVKGVGRVLSVQEIQQLLTA